MNIVRTGMLMLLLAGSARAQVTRQPANADAPDTKSLYNKTVMVKTLPASVVEKALRQAGKEKLYLEVYPVKGSAGSKTQDFDALVVFRDAHHTSYPERTVGEKQFEDKANNYARFVRAQKVPQSQVPFGYSIPVNWKTAGASNYKIGIDLQHFAILVKAGSQYVYRCDSCKCPPQCSGFGQPVASSSKPMLYSNRMEQVVQAAYLKQQH